MDDHAGNRSQAEEVASTIRESYRPRGTGGVHTLRSKDLAALQQRAAALIGGIDTHRSPAAGRPRLNPATGEHVIEVRYHGV